MAVMVVFAMLQFVLPEFAAIYQTFNTPLPALTSGLLPSRILAANGDGWREHSAR